MISATIGPIEAQMRHRAMLARQRLMCPPKPQIVLVAPPVPANDASERVPMWKRKKLKFNAHVIEWQKTVVKKGSPNKEYTARRAVELGFSYQEVIGVNRTRPVTRARQLIIWELKTVERPSISFPELGRLFRRDHTTILSSVRKIQRLKDEGAI